MEQHDAFRCDFTAQELVYFFFKKKECPKCRGMMDRRKEYEIVPGSSFNTKSADSFIPNAKVKHYIYVYKCQQCGSQYTLQELANRKEGK